MKNTNADPLYVDDPILRPQQAAAYLDSSPRTLLRLGLERAPMPGRAGIRWGYRRSTLNKYLEELAQSQESQRNPLRIRAD